MGYLMGIDMGSTSTKAVIYDIEGNIASFASRPTEVAHLDAEHPTWAFWEPDKVWGDTIAVIREATGKLSHPNEINGVAVTGMGQDGLPLDVNGQWLYPFISWHCPRTERQSRAWSEKIGAEKLFSISGKQVMPIDTVYRLIWMQENEPEILAKTDKWLLIEDFINFMLCGRQATDLSMASCTSLLDQKTRDWSDELIAQAGIRRQLFPEVLPSATVLGNITENSSSQTGLAQGTPVVLGGHDCICAALAVGAFQPNIMMDITGTWEIVLQSAPKLMLDQPIFKAGLTVESHVAKETYLTSGYSPSAMMLEWFKDNYGFEEKGLEKKSGQNIWTILMEKAAAMPCGANGAFFIPHFAGAGPPDNDNRSLGAFVGLSNATDKASMFRSMVEGLNYQFRGIVDAMEAALGINPKKIIAVGGASRIPFWMQNKADVTGRTIEVPAMEEATALGAAILAGIGVGIYRDEADALEQTFKPGRIYTPDEGSKSKYDCYYQIFKEISASLRDVNHRIFDKFRT